MENKILLNEKDLTYAQIVCSSIENADIRNRAVANVIAARTAYRYFEGMQYDVDCESGLHNIPQIMDEEDISDIYVNGAYVDVRVYFSKDELCVPKSHFDKGIEPVVYMFINLSQDLSMADVKGFINPIDVDKTNLKDGYYYLDENSLNDISDAEASLKSLQTIDVVPNEMIYKYLEGSLDEIGKISLYKNLLSSLNSRKMLIKAVKAQSVYRLVSTPQKIEENTDELPEYQELTEADLDDLLSGDENNDAAVQSNEYSTDVTPSGSDIIEQLDNDTINNANTEQIDTLFDGEQEGVPVPKKKGSNGFLLFVLLLLLIGAGGYYWYTNVYSQNALSDSALPEYTEEAAPQAVEQAPSNDAMPVETVDNNKNIQENKEEGNSIAIPAIEHNLDASVLVSNLKVDWEVPAGYASNTSAKRYLIKLGKKIQLDLKAELLLLTKPPIASRITVELGFDNKTGKFSFIGIKDSSGEKTVDDVISKTVKSAIDSSANSNNEAFAKLQGNPILIIHL